MENNELLLSICIPTNGIVDWVIPVIESIYAQGVDNLLFEVVVTDNGGKSDLAEAIKKFDQPNFHYYQTSSQGFTNQIDAFERCEGVFCKMLNHRSKMMPGSIEAILDIVRKYKEKKPILYFAEGLAKGGEFIECANVDEFVKSLGVWSSWSCGTGAWKEDLKDIRSKIVDVWFPHTVFLYSLRNESEYVIWNGKYENQANEKGKGGYDVFWVFSVSFLDILNDLRINNRVTKTTFLMVKKQLFNYLTHLYIKEVVLPTDRSFIIHNVRDSLAVYYGRYYYRKMVIESWIKAPYCYMKSKLRLLFLKVKNRKK